VLVVSIIPMLVYVRAGREGEAMRS
jgi:hypothetical protein